MPANFQPDREELQPNRIPKRIIAKVLHQSGPQWIGGQIPGNATEVFLRAQGMVMIAPLPERTVSSQFPVAQATAGRFEPVDHHTQALIFAKLDQKMGVIRHQHPGQHRGITKNGAILKTAGRRAASPKIPKKRLAVNGGRSHEISLVR